MLEFIFFFSFQECFPGSIYIAFIIKPEKFWEKQRTSIGSAKYNFEVSLTRLKEKEFL